jgi:hypothetical protein
VTGFPLTVVSSSLMSMFFYVGLCMTFGDAAA